MKQIQLDPRRRFIATTPAILKLRQFESMDDARKAAQEESRTHGTSFVLELKEKYAGGRQAA